MRLGPILVPSAIAVAICCIVAAQSGWLDGPSSAPGVVAADPAIQGTAPQARRDDAEPRAAAMPADPSSEPTAVGRSIGKAVAGGRPGPETGTLGSGGASLDSDGLATAPSPLRADPEPFAAKAPDALQQARDEADKAKQDVLDVTRDSLAAQRASEAEFERRTAELNEQIAQLRANVDAGRKVDAGAAGAAGAINAAEAKVATATAELADARARETTLRARLASVQAGDDASARPGAAYLKAAEKQAAERQAAVDKDAVGKAAETVAAADRGAADARATAKTMGERVAKLETEVAAKSADAEKVVAAQRALDETQARAKALDDRAGALQAELAAAKSTAATLDAKATAADQLQADLASARKQEEALAGQVAALRASAADATAQLQIKEEASAKKVSALQKDLDERRARENAAAARLVVAMNEPRAVDTRVPDSQALAALRDDLAGARRGEDTLRRENGVLRHELTEVKASTKALGEKLAALQVGVGQPVAKVSAPGRERQRATTGGSEHERLVRQLNDLKIEQMHQEVQALRIEAAKAGRLRDDRGTPSGAGSGRPSAVQPAASAARRRERQASREAVAVTRPVGSADGASASKGSARTGNEDSSATIAKAKSLIGSGNIDQARALLRQRGGSAATRALADTYNPLTNTQYGVIGVDTDTDKASYYYQQAARSAR